MFPEKNAELKKPASFLRNALETAPKKVPRTRKGHPPRVSTPIFALPQRVCCQEYPKPFNFVM
jgi:hypothetical protein